MSSFFIRTLSSLVAVAVVVASYYYFHDDGFRFLCLLAVILGTRELIQILFKPDDSFTIKSLFYFFMLIIFLMSVRFIELSSVVFAGLSILFFSLSLVFQRKFEDLQALSLFQYKSILGFLYLGLLPAFACKLLDLKNGGIWFVGLLAIVLTGDTLAYITGALWGKKKIMPKISPKKTVVGAIGGLCGSLLASVIISFYLAHIPLFAVLVVGFVAGTVGQFGDLFESLLKRVADIKDSGSLIPGHGGLLDRLDGVLFASPFLYFGALLLERIF